MIDSSVDTHQRLVVHQVTGALVLNELQQAVQFSSQHPAAAIVWDFRKTTHDYDPLQALQTLTTLLAWNKEDISTNKRAFIVNTQSHHDLLEQVLSRSPAPWSWALFLDADQALAWVAT